MSKDALFSRLNFIRLRAASCKINGVLFAVLFCLLLRQNLDAAEYQTPNFIILNASNVALAEQFGKTAERCRKELAVLWLGYELPQWSAPCPVTVKIGALGAGGETKFLFNEGEVYDWNMYVQGSVEAILTAVLPHEIMHTILASHFREPLPRWIEEGTATFVESLSEKQNYRRLLYRFLQSGRGIPFNEMFRFSQYPDDQMPLYSQAFSVTEFLIMQRGRRNFIGFIGAGLKNNNWSQAIRDYYGYENLGELQVKWNLWVFINCPKIEQISNNDDIILVSAKLDTTGQLQKEITLRDILPSRPPITSDLAISESHDIIPQPLIAQHVAKSSSRVVENRLPDHSTYGDITLQKEANQQNAQYQKKPQKFHGSPVIFDYRIR
ncbi:MAG: hypothetical protein LBT05_15335 [Planctomycetaceae bacterium]|nr:hypothetical protein [Planctomycetaceae bacterium]